MVLVVLVYTAIYASLTSLEIAKAWIDYARDIFMAFFLIIAAYAAFVGPFLQSRKKLLMVPDGKTNSIYFMNLGDPVIIRELDIGLASRIGMFGFPDFDLIPILAPSIVLSSGDSWRLAESQIREPLSRVFENQDYGTKIDQMNGNTKVFLIAFDRLPRPLLKPVRIGKELRLQPISCCIICDLETLRNSIQLNEPIQFIVWQAVALTPSGEKLFEFDVPSPKRLGKDEVC